VSEQCTCLPENRHSPRSASVERLLFLAATILPTNAHPVELLIRRPPVETGATTARRRPKLLPAVPCTLDPPDSIGTLRPEPRPESFNGMGSEPDVGRESGVIGSRRRHRAQQRKCPQTRCRHASGRPQRHEPLARAPQPRIRPTVSVRSCDLVGTSSQAAGQTGAPGTAWHTDGVNCSIRVPCGPAD
jgi:hypothetical protein